MTIKVSEIAVALPFTISSYGNVATTTEQSKIWADRVRSAIGTMLGERVMRPNYGSNIPHNMFDNESETVSRITDEVTDIFFRELPLLTLTSVDVSFDENQNLISADIVYALPNDQIVATNVGVASISGNNPISQETL